MKGTEQKEDGVIVLDKNYTLKRDPHCWVLLYQEKRKDKETGEDKLVKYDPQYYPSVKVALQYYLDNALKPAKDVQQLVELIKETYARIEEVCKGCPDKLAEKK